MVFNCNDKLIGNERDISLLVRKKVKKLDIDMDIGQANLWK